MKFSPNIEKAWSKYSLLWGMLLPLAVKGMWVHNTPQGILELGQEESYF